MTSGPFGEPYRKADSPLAREVHLRPVFKDDWPLLFAWRQDREVMALLPSAPKHPTWEVHQAFWDALPGSAQYYMVIHERRPIGVVHMRDDHEVGIIIGEKDLWGRGYGGEAVRQLLQRLSSYGPNQGMRVHALVHPDNAASIRLFEENGFADSGETGRGDQRVYARRL